MADVGRWSTVSGKAG